MPSAWITHVKSVYAKGKGKGMSYKAAMIAAKKTYKKKGAAAASSEEAAPKKRRGRKKKNASEEGRGGRVKKDTGLGNVEEGRLADAAKPKKKRQRKRPTLGSMYKGMN